VAAFFFGFVTASFLVGRGIARRLREGRPQNTPMAN